MTDDYTQDDGVQDGAQDNNKPDPMEAVTKTLSELTGAVAAIQDALRGKSEPPDEGGKKGSDWDDMDWDEQRSEIKREMDEAKTYGKRAEAMVVASEMAPKAARAFLESLPEEHRNDAALEEVTSVLKNYYAADIGRVTGEMDAEAKRALRLLAIGASLDAKPAGSVKEPMAMGGDVGADAGGGIAKDLEELYGRKPTKEEIESVKKAYVSRTA